MGAIAILSPIDLNGFENLVVMHRTEHTPRFQFRLIHVFLLTTVVAAVMGLLVRLVSPELFVAALQGGPKILLSVIAAYVIAFGGWAFLRGPTVVATLRQLRQKRRAITEQQAMLTANAAERIRKRDESVCSIRDGENS